MHSVGIIYCSGVDFLIRASVLGATGYAGEELVRILAAHPKVKIVHLISKSYAGEAFSDVYQSFTNILDIKLEDIDVERISKDSDVVFTALPHGACSAIVPKFIEAGVRVIDFSGDYRYTDKDIYEKWYGIKHNSPHLLKKAVYGLCELNRKEIAGKALVANPGCYTTCSILALAPAVAEKIIDTSSIIIDAKSGVTGAGRSASLDFSFCECAENMKAYKVAEHRHTSEIEQQLSMIANEEITLTFSPHLMPLKRGIIATCYANLKDTRYSTQEIIEIYKDFYKNERFIRIYPNGRLPEIKYITSSNYTDIGLKVDGRNCRLIVVCCLDNLVKGAAGQAVQNMNILFGIAEETGIDSPPIYL
ncbi:MAG: N-acetyl-gamma-glutamyl-phosphate reductase [Firmicutes bacterium]|nr:N-acetyl-gamma-glutamyl-phosphate reductase [Bacillota bacterium]